MKKGILLQLFGARTKVWQEVVAVVDLDSEVILTFSLLEILVQVNLSSFR
jgi:hypothetical protein